MGIVAPASDRLRTCGTALIRTSPSRAGRAAWSTGAPVATKS